MGAKMTPGRPAYEKQLEKLGPLPQFYTLLVQMKRSDFTAERIRRARKGKAVDFEVLEVLEQVSADYAKTLKNQPQAVAA
jgi:hypothetical protein